AAVLHLVGAAAQPGAVALDDDVDQVLLVGVPEDLVGKVELPHDLVAQVLDLDLHGSALLGALDGDVGAGGARHGAGDQDDVLVGVDAHHLEVLSGDAAAAHPPRRPHARVDARGERGGADRAGRAVEHRAVGGAPAAEAVALDDALEALALAGGDHVDVLAGGEDRGLHLVARLPLLVGLDLELGETTRRGHAGLLEVALLRLADVARRPLLDQAELHRLVAVAVLGLALHDQAGADLEDGDRDHRPVVAEDLGHADFLSEDAFHYPLLAATAHLPLPMLSLRSSVGFHPPAPLRGGMGP